MESVVPVSVFDELGAAGARSGGAYMSDSENYFSSESDLDEHSPWMALECAGQPPGPMWGHQAALLDTTHVAFIGGSRRGAGVGAGGTCLFNVLDLLTLRMQDKTHLMERSEIPILQGHTVTTVDDRVFIYGGRSTSAIQNKMYVYDKEEDFVDVLPPEEGSATPPLLAYHIAVFWRGTNGNERHIITFGGHLGHGKSTDALWDYNVDTNMWHEISSSGKKPKKRASHTGCAIGNYLFIFGGEAGHKTLNDLHCLDMSRMTWIKVKLRDTKKNPKERHGHSMIAIRDSLVVFGGLSSNLEFLSSVHAFVMRSSTDAAGNVSHIEGEWKKLSVRNAPAGRFFHVTCLIGARVLMYGGAALKNTFSDLVVMKLPLSALSAGKGANSFTNQGDRSAESIVLPWSERKNINGQSVLRAIRRPGDTASDNGSVASAGSAAKEPPVAVVIAPPHSDSESIGDDLEELDEEDEEAEMLAQLEKHTVSSAPANRSGSPNGSMTSEEKRRLEERFREERNALEDEIDELEKRAEEAAAQAAKEKRALQRQIEKLKATNRQHQGGGGGVEDEDVATIPITTLTALSRFLKDVTISEIDNDLLDRLYRRLKEGATAVGKEKLRRMEGRS